MKKKNSEEFSKGQFNRIKIIKFLDFVKFKITKWDGKIIPQYYQSCNGLYIFFNNCKITSPFRWYKNRFNDFKYSEFIIVNVNILAILIRTLNKFLKVICYKKIKKENESVSHQKYFVSSVIPWMYSKLYSKLRHKILQILSFIFYVFAILL